MTRPIRASTFTPLAAAAAFALCAAAPAHAELIVGLTTTNALITFDSSAPGNATTPANITGLLPNEQILSIDRRPTTGVIYGVSDQERVYSLTTSGAATLIGTVVGATFASDVLGIDFNPAADLGTGASLRIISSTGQNLAFNVNSGATVLQSPIQANLSSIAYANNDTDPVTTTRLYYFDTATDQLKTAGSDFNNPVITTVGAFGVNANGVNGFDISGTGASFAALTDADTSKSGLYTVNLGTGALTFVGAFGIGGNFAIAPPLLGLTSVAAIPEPETYALMLAGLGALGFVARRRRRA